LAFGKQLLPAAPSGLPEAARLACPRAPSGPALGGRIAP